MRTIVRHGLAGAALLPAALTAPAAAQTAVNFNGTVVSSCVITVSASGTLGVDSASGTAVGSEVGAGAPAVLSVVATAGTPTISFTAPTLSAKPSAYSGAPTLALRYSSPGGANQAYTTGASQYRSSNPLGDTITLNARATDASGFAAGTYQIQTIATCQQ